MKRSFVSLVAAGLLAGGLNSTALAQAPVCADYLSVLEAPELQLPPEAGFRKWRNNWLSWWATPYHMVHDQVVAEGETATVVGKFDYDKVLHKVLHKDLEFEDVDVYMHGTGLNDWLRLGRFRTNSDGKISVPVTAPAGEYELRMVVVGDNSMASGYLTVVDSTREAIVFDIDGTLTRSDFEQVRDWIGIEQARAWPGAIETVNAYVDKGYQVFYLTARPYFKASLTRDWLSQQGALDFWLRTTMNFTLPGDATEAYKTRFLGELQAAGVTIKRVYGNADTDIAAYENVGMAKSETYIIGENAGAAGTQPLIGGYWEHLASVVAATPEANCQPR